MALQGTLDTFELPDVLRLLASTRKSGRLHLQGDRGDGSIWLTDGHVVAVLSEGSPEGDIGDGLFDLFRAREGGFAFEPGVEPRETTGHFEVEPLLESTEVRLAEWREIEAVVPSMHAWVSLNAELPDAEVRIDSATWRLVATVGSGVTVAELGGFLQLAEVPVCRVVRDLVLLGLGVITDAPAPMASTEASWDPMAGTNGHFHLNGSGGGSGGVNGVNGVNGVDGFEVVNGSNGSNGHAFGADVAVEDGHGLNGTNGFGAEPMWDPFETTEEPAAVFAVEEPVGYGIGVQEASPDSAFEPVFDPIDEAEAAQGYEPVAELVEDDAPADQFVPGEAAFDDSLGMSDADDDDADEVARQLAMLSPRAAQAVAAAAAADSEHERDAHLDALEEGDEPINRGLLLKFLSSVKG